MVPCLTLPLVFLPLPTSKQLHQKQSCTDHVTTTEWELDLLIQKQHANTDP